MNTKILEFYLDCIINMLKYTNLNPSLFEILLKTKEFIWFDFGLKKIKQRS